MRDSKIPYTSSRPFKCDKCGSGFKRRYDLTVSCLCICFFFFQAKRIMINFPLFCFFVFCFLLHLKKHSRVHSDQRPFQCGVCGRAFKDPSDMRVSRLELLTPKCDIDVIHILFLLYFHLQRHLDTHSDDRPFKCGECIKSFKRQFDLNVSIKFILNQFIECVYKVIFFIHSQQLSSGTVNCSTALYTIHRYVRTVRIE